MWKRRSRGRIPGWGGDHPRGREAAIRLGLRHEACDGGGRARRGRGGDRRARRRGRPAGLDPQAPACARLGPAVRRRRAARPAGDEADLLERRDRAGRRARRRGRRDAVRGVLRRRLEASRWAARRPTASRRRSNPSSLWRSSCSRPHGLAAETLAEAAAVQFPGLGGVLPGFGRQEPNDWGLGLELRDGKSPHWTGARNSPDTFGHFGRAGGFLWVDPGAGVALACLTDLDFGDWAKDAWPELADAVLAEA